MGCGSHSNSSILEARFKADLIVNLSLKFGNF